MMRTPLLLNPTLAEVQLFCAKAGIPESDANWFWCKCEGNDWTNNGRKIKNWSMTLMSWKHAGYLPSQRQPRINGHSAQPAQQSNGAMKVIWGKELERISERIRVIRGTYEGLQALRPADRAELTKLKARRDELKKELGVVI